MNDFYEHSGERLNEWIAQKILWDMPSPKRRAYSLHDLASFVVQEHTKSGGIRRVSFSEEIKFTKKALLDSQRTGSAVHISGNRWELPASGQRIFGKGKEWVYLFYYKDECPKRSWILEYDATWPCKIGTTSNSPEKRVDDYIKYRKRRGLRVPTDPPALALLLRTNKGELLEKALHACLKFQGKHIVDAEEKEYEVFDTNVNHVINLYGFLMGHAPNTLLI